MIAKHVGLDAGLGHPLCEADLALRWQRSKRTLQRWRKAGRMPLGFVLGRSWYYREADVEAFEARGHRSRGVGA